MLEEIMDDIFEDVISAASCRLGVWNSVPKSMHWSLDILTQLDDNRFLQMMRVTRIEFHRLVSVIREDDEFNNSPSCLQFPVEYQVAIVLYRLGSSGEGASIRKIATFFGIGDGGTIDKITRRVFKAFLNLQTEYISWPDENERASIVAETFHELPFCIGYVDGTEIPIAESPVINGVSFFSRTHKYSLKAQVTCDFKRRIRHVVVGNPGSVHDSKIFKNCDIYKEPQNYFSSHQWIAGDSAYSLSPTIITPYRSNSNQMDSGKRRKFNRRHSSYRVRIENCFGWLKEKFYSLTNLKMRIDSSRSHFFCCQWFLVCCIIHNILLDEKEVQNREQLDDTESDEEPNVDNEEEQEIILSNKIYEYKRQAIYSLMFN